MSTIEEYNHLQRLVAETGWASSSPSTSSARGEKRSVKVKIAERPTRRRLKEK